MELTGPERNCRCVWVLFLGILPTSCPSVGVGTGLEMLWGWVGIWDGLGQGGAGCEAGVSHPGHQVS